MCDIVIRGERSAQLAIRIKGLAHPGSPPCGDRNWVNAEISICSGSFKGQVPVCLNTREIKVFYDEMISLTESFKGTAHYYSFEDWMQIEVSGDGLGHFTAKGFVADDFNEDIANKLYFSIILDQTWTPPILKGLKETLEKYPVFKD